MTQTNYNERLDEIVEKICGRDKSLNEAVIKSALTQLFKDLVVEAKPVRMLPESDDSVAVYYEKMLFEFEQNLLRLLETK